MQPVVSMIVMLIIIGVASFITVAGITLIALGSSGAFSPERTYTKSTTTATTLNNSTNGTVPVALLNNATIYPNGSTLVNLSSYGNLSGSLSVATVNSSIISEINGIDASSAIFEAVRTQYLYFVFRNSTYDPSNHNFSTQINNNSNNITTTSTATVTGIIIQFDTADGNSGVLIPLTNITSGINQVSANGLSIFNTTDGVVIQIKLSVPTTLCPSANSQPIDGCYSLTYQVYAVVNSSSITSSPSQSTVSLACGNVCSLSNNTCSASCTTCGSQQTSSNVTIATRRYTTNSTVGRFQFNYTTNNPQQQVNIYEDGTPLFFANCTTTQFSSYLAYNSTSSLIRVDIEPDFSCTNSTNNGTAWSFIIGCLIPWMVVAVLISMTLNT